jgi:nitrite reductase/ring-hydroxylating ferredoxin subunit
MAGIPDIKQWVPIGLSAGLSPGAVQRSLIHSCDLAVWRGVDSTVRAWENRCPHRGMRLSFGFVRENKLTCIYHGWAYDGDGACARIPAHPSLVPPKTITVGKFLCAENNGLIWFAAEGVTAPTPSAEGTWIACRSIAIEAPAASVVEALCRAVFPPFANNHSTDVGAGSGPHHYRALVGGSNIAYESRLIDGHLVYVRSNVGEAILCGVQPVAENLTSVHLLIAGSFAFVDVPRARRHYANWAKRLRLYLESGELAQDGQHPWQAAA